jgi:hypothetical protein
MKAIHQNDDHDWESCMDCVKLKIDHRTIRYQSGAESRDIGADPPLNDCLVDLHAAMMSAL